MWCTLRDWDKWSPLLGFRHRSSKSTWKLTIKKRWKILVSCRFLETGANHCFWQKGWVKFSTKIAFYWRKCCKLTWKHRSWTLRPWAKWHSIRRRRRTQLAWTPIILWTEQIVSRTLQKLLTTTAGCSTDSNVLRVTTRLTSRPLTSIRKLK